MICLSQKIRKNPIFSTFFLLPTHIFNKKTKIHPKNPIFPPKISPQKLPIFHGIFPTAKGRIFFPGDAGDRGDFGEIGACRDMGLGAAVELGGAGALGALEPPGDLPWGQPWGGRPGGRPGTWRFHITKCSDRVHESSSTSQMNVDL